MMQFIYCFDERLKQDLISKGYQLMNSNGNCSVFVNNSNLHFDFINIDKNKYSFNNKMLF